MTQIPDWVPLTRAAPMLGVSRELLAELIEAGSVSYHTSGNRRYVNIEQAREDLKEAAAANRRGRRPNADRKASAPASAPLALQKYVPAKGSKVQAVSL